MNKKQLATKVAKEASITIAQAERYVDVMFRSIRESVIAGESTTIKGFGSFSVGSRSARRGINPSTKQPLSIPACRVMKFKPSKSVKIN